jgi:type IV fimbrial biogenesis protein FimT
MVTVVIAGILMAVGIPQMGEWIRRNSVGSAAETVQNGLRQAEAEAIRRNQRVEFLLTNAAPSQSGILSLTAADNGKNWAVRARPMPSWRMCRASRWRKSPLWSWRGRRACSSPEWGG